MRSTSGELSWDDGETYRRRIYLLCNTSSMTFYKNRENVDKVIVETEIQYTMQPGSKIIVLSYFKSQLHCSIQPCYGDKSETFPLIQSFSFLLKMTIDELDLSSCGNKL